MWWLPHGKTKHLALMGSFRGQIAEADLCEVGHTAA